jgi:CubicO group peptidase (beta-lactamase class C family)
MRRFAGLLTVFVLLMPALTQAQPSASSLETAARTAGTLPRLRSLLVSHRGAIVLERYVNGARATQHANIKSASKSVIAALVGIAIGKGHIKTIDDKIAAYLPELGKDPDPAKRAISIGDLVTMRSGLESTSGRGYGAWVQSKNWVQYVLRRPLVDRPGTRVEYSTGSTHLLSAIVTRATKMSTWQFAQEELARPLGFSLAKWITDPQGVYFGGNEMSMTPRQMLAFGELYLNHGRVGDRQVIPKAWVDKADDGVGRSRWGSDCEYGHGFWIRDFGGVKSYYAWGYGGQFIFIIPDKDL